MTIRMNEPSITDLEREYVNQAMNKLYWEGDSKESWYWNEEFQEKFAQYIGRKYCITTPSCTTSIHLLLKGLEIGQGDEVIIPNLTWIATAAPAYHLGAKLVFADVDPITWCISLSSIEKLITPQTKAIIAVDLYGNMPNYHELEKFCEENNIYLIEDAAEGIGSTYHNRKAGQFGIGSVFSFHRTKTLTMGENGCIVTDDEELYNKCMILRDHGKDPTKMYYNVEVGFKYMPANVLSAIGLAQLQRVDELLERKKWEFLTYQKYLDIPNIQWNYSDDYIENGYWMTAIVFGESWNVNKHYMVEELKKREIPSRPFFYPLTSLPAFNKEENIDNKHKNITPISYSISERGINLPTSPSLTEEDIKYICDSVKEILEV